MESQEPGDLQEQGDHKAHLPRGVGGTPMSGGAAQLVPLSLELVWSTVAGLPVVTTLTLVVELTMFASAKHLSTSASTL